MCDCCELYPALGTQGGVQEKTGRKGPAQGSPWATDRARGGTHSYRLLVPRGGVDVQHKTLSQPLDP